MWASTKGLWKNDRLSRIPGLYHFTTARSLGDGRLGSVRKKTLALAGAEGSRLILPAQVSGISARVITEGKGSRFRADALLTKNPSLALGIVSADCLPIFLVDEEHRAVALVHAGWRGLSQGILKRAARVMKKSFGTRPSKCLAAIGPHIHSCCYQVGFEVARLFHPSAVRRFEKGRYRLNLGQVAARQLRELGFPLRFSEVCPACTGCRPKDFFSYRKEGASQRMLSALGFL